MSLPTTNITTAIIRNILSEDQNAVFHLAVSPNINKWSKNKPVRDAGMGANWPAGNDSHYGLDLPLWSGITHAFENSTDADTWDYLHPRGGSPGGTPDEPGRLGDFRGYEHDDSLTFPTIYCKDSDQDKNPVLSPAQPSGGASSGTALAKMKVSASSVRPTIGGMGLTDFYFGILVFTPSGEWFIKTNPNKVSTGDEATGLSFVYQADVVDRTDPDSEYTNLPYGVGNFTIYYVISDANYSAWTQDPDAVIYLLPAGAVTGLTFENSYAFEVEDWVYAATGSMGFAYDDDTAAEYIESIIYCSIGSEPWSVDLDSALWAEYEVYAPDGTTKVTNPALYGNAYRLRVFPISENGGNEKTGTVMVTGTNAAPYPISVTQNAHPAYVNVYPGDDAELTVSNTGGNVVGALNIEFTPSWLNGSGNYSVGWQIAVNGVRVYSSYGITTLSVSDNVHENLQSIDYGSATWEDGDVIDVFIYYNQAPPLV